MQASDSRVLFLFICSDTKTRQAESSAYDPAGSIIQHLSVTAAETLVGARRGLRHLITNSDKIARDGTPLRRLRYNKDLAPGPEFTTKREMCGGATYLPAAKRYRGRFYQELDPAGPALLLGTRHHVLIVSGLYGLLTPAEPIQCYSCHVPDHPSIAQQWKSNNLLTNLIVAYMQRYSIERVFDFMGDDNYRDLIAWDTVRRSAKRDVLHGYSNQFIREAQLRPLGYVARRFLPADSATLMAIRPGDTEYVPTYDDDILFRATVKPPARPPQPQAPAGGLRPEDQIVRMRKNIGRIVDCITGSHGGDIGFPTRIQALIHRGDLTSEMRGPMLEINRVRNLVVHDYYRIPPPEWQGLQQRYAQIVQWTRQRYRNCIDMLPLESIDS